MSNFLGAVQNGWCTFPGISNNIDNYYITSKSQVKEIPVIDGIIYLSSNISGLAIEKIDENEFCNYVFPTRSKIQKGHCHELSAMFTITEPVTLRYFCEKTVELINRHDIDVESIIELSHNGFENQFFLKAEQLIRSKHIRRCKLN